MLHTRWEGLLSSAPLPPSLLPLSLRLPNPEPPHSVLSTPPTPHPIRRGAQCLAFLHHTVGSPVLMAPAWRPHCPCPCLTDEGPWSVLLPRGPPAGPVQGVPPASGLETCRGAWGGGRGGGVCVRENLLERDGLPDCGLRERERRWGPHGAGLREKRRGPRAGPEWAGPVGGAGPAGVRPAGGGDAPPPTPPPPRAFSQKPGGGWPSGKSPSSPFQSHCSARGESVAVPEVHSRENRG